MELKEALKSRRSIQKYKDIDIPKEIIEDLLEILKQRCDWFKQNEIDQWGDWYYTELYDKNYFIKMMKIYKLYVVKQNNEVVGAFLLKT